MQTDGHLQVRGLLKIVEIAETMNHCKPRIQVRRFLGEISEERGNTINPESGRHRSSSPAP